ncbi:MAG: S1/P1 nuclease [Gemmatimonadales bacterium]
MSASVLLALIGTIASAYHPAATPIAGHEPVPLLTARPATVFWYDEGHRLVARLAEERLTPQAAAAVRELLGGQRLADAALWADRIRAERPDTKPLHYVNIPLAARSYLPARDCPTGRCIIAAIERDRLTLANARATPAARAEALRFLAHLIGDLHQPLHVADDGDRGGNDRRVTFLGVPKNLHKVWDGELIEAVGLSEEQYYARLRRRMDSLDLPTLERGTTVDWAMEGHDVAARRAYRLTRGATIDRDYVEASLPSVDRALIAAGVRLARVLNEALSGYGPIVAPVAR